MTPPDPVVGPAEEGDREFLFRLLSSSRCASTSSSVRRLGRGGAARELRRALRLPTHEILEQGGRAIGCLSTAQLPDAIALAPRVPAARGAEPGLGSALVREVIGRGAALGLPVRLRVFKTNPAHELYRRLGFAVVGETETHFQMERAARAAGGVLVRDRRVLLRLAPRGTGAVTRRVGRVRRSLRGQRVAARGWSASSVEELGIELRAARRSRLPATSSSTSAWRGEPANLGDEHDEIAWFSRAELTSRRSALLALPRTCSGPCLPAELRREVVGCARRPRALVAASPGNSQARA